jgi:hypothetical protein
LSWEIIRAYGEYSILRKQAKNLLMKNSLSQIPVLVSSSVAFALVFGGIVATTATYFMGCATLAYGFMVSGVLFRRHRRVHSRFMITAIALDLTIVATLEIQRHAVDSALAFSLSPLQQLHIASSSVATVLYFPILFLGWRLLRGNFSPTQRKWHIRLGTTAFTFRTLGFLLMFSLLATNPK